MTKAEASTRLEAALPQGVLATVPAGHLGFWEQRSEASELLAEFVERFRRTDLKPRQAAVGAADADQR